MNLCSSYLFDCVVKNGKPARHNKLTDWSVLTTKSTSVNKKFSYRKKQIYIVGDIGGVGGRIYSNGCQEKATGEPHYELCKPSIGALVAMIVFIIKELWG